MDQPIKLTEMPNIGKVVAEKLCEVGISTPEELKAIGSEQAFIRLQTIDETACFSMFQHVTRTGRCRSGNPLA